MIFRVALYVLLMSVSSLPALNASRSEEPESTIVSFTNLPTEILPIIVSFMDIETAVNIFGLISKKCWAIADQSVSQRPIIIKSNNINNNTLANFFQHRILFENLTFIYLPPKNIILGKIYRYTPGTSLSINTLSAPENIINTTLKILSIDMTYEQLFSMRSVAQITSLQSLECLSIVYPSKTNGIELPIVFNNPTFELSRLVTLTKLKKLSLSSFSISPCGNNLSNLVNLEELSLKACSITNLEFLAKHTKLISLDLRYNSLGVDFDFQTGINYSAIDNPLEVKTLSPILSLTNLKMLDLSDRILSRESQKALLEAKILFKDAAEKITIDEALDSLGKLTSS